MSDFESIETMSPEYKKKIDGIESSIGEMSSELTKLKLENDALKLEILDSVTDKESLDKYLNNPIFKDITEKHQEVLSKKIALLTYKSKEVIERVMRDYSFQTYSALLEQAKKSEEKQMYLVVVENECDDAVNRYYTDNINEFKTSDYSLFTPVKYKQKVGLYSSYKHNSSDYWFFIYELEDVLTYKLSSECYNEICKFST